ncbi:peptidase S8 [Wenjunlia vitaminophila]|uniref:Peptidase S8 n=1 Tax=Wenjunlia vitaminophila TaxID=76728 RepID=A0A0T6LU57_WENVI|nr:S8 family serine peptidase [Wenjunlia vitaminophila]KRV49308.1 peptidase S8 [Wenjunlia vitaminophila]
MSAVPARRRRAATVPLSIVAAAVLACTPLGVSAASADSGGDGERATAAAEGPTMSYVVNTRTGSGAIHLAEKAVKKAGGTVVMSYPQIGVVVAHSTNPQFAQEMRSVRGISSVGSTRTVPIRSAATTEVGKPTMVSAEQSAEAEAQATAGQEPKEPLQWDLPAIKADKAHAISTGSSKVNVAVIDTGVDDTHEDLKANFDRDSSVSCVGGAPDTSDGAWRPFPDSDGNYHGTHVAGTIAAPRNGTGVAGVAPGVKVSAIKVSEPGNSLFYSESVVCGFVWAAEHGADVTNNSYYVDPWLFNCPSDPDQKAIAEAVGRAAAYAQHKGVLNVAAAGNDYFDLAADELVDESSPDDSEAVSRTIDPSVCLDVPGQLPGVVTVSATGAKTGKSYFSNYGLGVIDVAAPGGDRRVAPDAPYEDGRILSTLPNNEYGYLQGTSMASPHAAGVAALLKSTHPWASPKVLQMMMKAQADPVACPELYDYNGDGKADAVCEGTKEYNGFYGHGLVDALDAVRR